MVMNNYGDDDDDDDEGMDGIMFSCTIEYSAPRLYFCTVFIRCTRI